MHDERIRQQHQSLFRAKRKVSTSTFLFCSWKAHTAKCAFSSASFLSHGSGSLPRCDFVILPRNQGVSTPAPCSFTSVTRTFSTRPGTPNSLPIGSKTFGGTEGKSTAGSGRGWRGCRGKSIPVSSRRPWLWLLTLTIKELSSLVICDPVYILIRNSLGDYTALLKQECCTSSKLRLPIPVA